MASEQKLFVFDVDGTLLSDDHTILPETLAEIRRLSALGHAIVVATGRSFGRSVDIATTIGAKIRLIANNGALTYDFFNESFKVHAIVPRASVDYLVTLAQKYRRELGWSSGLSSHVVYFGEDPLAEITDQRFFTTGTVHRVYENWDAVKHTLLDPSAVQQVTLKAEPHLIEGLVDEVKEALAGVCEVTDTSRVYIDVNAAGISKWVAVRQLQEMLGIPNDRTYAFGDSPNDLLMIKNVGVGVAMGNAKNSVKQVAKHIIGNNNGPAIAAFLASIA